LHQEKSGNHAWRQGGTDELAKKSPKMLLNPFLCKFMHNFFSLGKKLAQEVGLHTSAIEKKLPKENKRPIGENSPNLVTLLGE
jgi:hypothetical protein